MSAAALLTLCQGADVKLLTSGRVNLTDSTVQVKCQVNKVPNSNTILILLQIDRLTDNGATPIASQRGSGVVLQPGVNGTGTLNSVDGAKLEVSLPLTDDPETVKEATFRCRFGYLNMEHDFQFHLVHDNVTVSLIEPAEPTPPPLLALGDCACDQVWAEVKSLRETLIAQNVALKKQLTAYDDACRVSFTAKLKEAKNTGFHSNRHVKFDAVISNKGEAYNVTTGSFEAPCSGQYYFRVSLRTQQEFDSGHVDAAIEVDDVEVARTSVFTSDRVDHYEQASNGLVLTLTQGAQVRVRIQTNSQGRIYGDGYSIFSGFFISP